MKNFLIITLLLTITACQGSSTIGPTVSGAELAKEQQYQRQYVKDLKVEELKNAPVISKSMERTFKKVATRIGVAGEDLCREIAKQVKQKECVFGFKLKKDKVLNAYADGDNIIITTAMMKFAKREEEFANVMAHEYAHNVMSHVAKTKQNVTIGAVLGTVIEAGLGSQGISTGGALANAGAQAGLLKYSVGFEREADYIGMYIMARAGYKMDKVPEFWRKMSAANEQAIDTAVTHPTNAERFIALNKTINEIKSKRKIGLPLTPEFIPAD